MTGVSTILSNDPKNAIKYGLANCVCGHARTAHSQVGGVCGFTETCTCQKFKNILEDASPKDESSTSPHPRVMLCPVEGGVSDRWFRGDERGVGTCSRCGRMEDEHLVPDGGVWVALRDTGRYEPREEYGGKGPDDEEVPGVEHLQGERRWEIYEHKKDHGISGDGPMLAEGERIMVVPEPELREAITSEENANVVIRQVADRLGDTRRELCEANHRVIVLEKALAVARECADAALRVIW